MEDDAEKLLRTQFKMEMLVYTQDRTYSGSLDESKEEEPKQRNSFLKNNHATLVELMLHLKSYYRVRVTAHYKILSFIFTEEDF